MSEKLIHIVQKLMSAYPYLSIGDVLFDEEEVRIHLHCTIFQQVTVEKKETGQRYEKKSWRAHGMRDLDVVNEENLIYS